MLTFSPLIIECFLRHIYAEMIEVDEPQNLQKNFSDILKYAKISESELAPEYQEIKFCPTLSATYKLVEIDNNILADLERGKKLYIRGEADDSAVICSEDRTYSVREAEISNTVLIMPECAFPQQSNQYAHISQGPSIAERKIVGMCHTYWELKQEYRINAKKIKSCLAEVPFCGPEKESSRPSGKLYTLDNLLDKIPASEAEILSAIQKLRAGTYQGKIRLIDFEYLVRLTNEVLEFIEENSWSWRAVDYGKTLAELSNLEPKVMLEKWFELFASKNHDGSSWSLKEAEICRLHGEIILTSVEKMYLNDFKQAWQGSVPVGMTTDLNMLRGLAITEQDVRSIYVMRLEVDSLSDDPAKRFVELFGKKSRWSLEEITPYVEDLVLDQSSNISALLTKHCRHTVINGVKYYTSRSS